MSILTMLAALLGIGRQDNYKNVQTDEFARIIANPLVQLVDARTSGEFQEDHLAKSVNIDFLSADFMQKATSSLDKSRPVAIYCRSGKRSADAAAKLAKEGFDVVNLLGGIMAWKGARKPVTQEIWEDLDITYARELLKAGESAPDFTLKDLRGKPRSLHEFKGKKVVLVFWASWCPDCRAEIPQLKALQASTDPAKVAFVSVSYDRDYDTLCQFVDDNNLGGIQLFDPAGKKDSKVGADYRVKWIPSLYLLDENGKVLLSTVMIERLTAALGEDTAAATSSSAPKVLCEDDSCSIQ